MRLKVPRTHDRERRLRNLAAQQLLIDKAFPIFYSSWCNSLELFNGFRVSYMATIDIVREEEVVERTSSRYIDAGRYADFEDYVLPYDPDVEWSEAQTLPFAGGGRNGPPFVYDVLTDECDRLRLLRIFPQERDDFYDSPPECELTTFDLNSAPPYMALSYSWGSPDCPKYISYINNHIWEDTWENLYNFMCHFRQDPFNQRPKYIWVGV
jgi:hypothetical protein